MRWVALDMIGICWSSCTTLNVVFSVAYYLELRNVVIFNYVSSHFINQGQIGCLDIIKQQHLYLIICYIDNEKI